MGNMVSNLNEYFGKRVFITGDTGFKGSWLALWLSQLGAETRGYALPAQNREDHYNSAGVSSDIDHVDGDIRDFERLSRSMLEFEPEIVFHLAAQAIVRRSYRDPRETFETNVMGSVNVLESARYCKKLRAIIYVTSDKCYLNKEWAWGYRENDELGGHDPYSASKAAAEIVLSSYRRAFFSKVTGLGAASVRAGNVIGGGDWAEDRIVPDCIRALSAKKPIEIRNPLATRPWQHVLEPLFGYLRLGLALFKEPILYSEAWNFGPESSSFKTVEELVRLIIDEWGEGDMNANYSTEAPHEARLLHLNCDKAHSVLNWSPRWDFENTICKTIDWYKAGNKRETSLNQIEEFTGDNI